jgi:amino acid permease
MVLGIALFGDQAKPFLLNNLSSNDSLALVARLAFGASVLASFPLIFLVMRNWFVSIAKKSIAPQLGGTRRMTVVLLFATAILSSKFTDVSFVGSLAGATLGTSMAFIFPSLIYIRTLLLHAKQTGTKASLLRIIFNSILLFFGLSLSFIGTFNSIFSFK